MYRQAGRFRYMKPTGTCLVMVFADMPQTKYVAYIPVFSTGHMSKYHLLLF
jgi:hypothetical protein